MTKKVTAIKKAADVAVGEELVLTKDYYGEGATVMAIAPVVKVTKTQIVVEHPEPLGTKTTLRFRETRWGGMETMGERSTYRSSKWAGCYIRKLTEGEDVEKLKKAIADRKAKQDAAKVAEAAKKKAEQEEKAAAFREKVEGYWKYAGRELYENAPEVDTCVGKAKVLTFVHRGDERVTVLARIWQAEADSFSAALAKEQGKEVPKIWKAVVGGLREGYRGCEPNSMSCSLGRADSLEEMIYQIVH